MNIYIGFNTKNEANELLEKIESGEERIPRSGYVNINFLKKDMGNDAIILEVELSSDARLDYLVESTDRYVTYRESDTISIKVLENKE
jgi:hypothetical protein